MPRYEITWTHIDGSTRLSTMEGNDVIAVANTLHGANWRVTQVVELAPNPPKPKQHVISRWSIGDMKFHITSDGGKFYLYDITRATSILERDYPNPRNCLWSSKNSDDLLLLATRMANGAGNAHT